jgi:hypothetical protein
MNIKYMSVENFGITIKKLGKSVSKTATTGANTIATKSNKTGITDTIVTGAKSTVALSNKIVPVVLSTVGNSYLSFFGKVGKWITNFGK